MDFFTIIAACAALVWLSWFVLRGSLIGGCVAVIIIGSCFGYLFWHAEGGVPVTADRALIGVLAVSYILHRRWGQADPKPVGRAEWVMFTVVALLAISTFTHDWKSSTTSPPAVHWIFYWVMPALVYWIARQSPLDDRTLSRAWAALAIFGVYLTFTGLAEATGQYWAVFPPYIASSKTEYFGRARGPFLNPAEMGIFLTTCLAAALMFWSRLGRVGQLFLTGFTVLSMAAIYATLTRSAWMGGALGLSVVIALNVPKSWRRLLLSCSLITGIALFAAKWDSIWNLKRDVNLDASASVESAELRPILAKVAYEMFLDRPLWGCGFGQYDKEKMPYIADRSISDLPLEKVAPYVQHNSFLALLVETGLLGMGAFVLLLLLWIRNAWKIYRDPNSSFMMRQTGVLFLALLGAYLPSAMFQDTNIIDGVNLLLFFVAGTVSGLAANIAVNPKQQIATSAFRAERLPELTVHSI